MSDEFLLFDVVLVFDEFFVFEFLSFVEAVFDFVFLLGVGVGLVFAVVVFLSDFDLLGVGEAFAFFGVGVVLAFDFGVGAVLAFFLVWALLMSPTNPKATKAKTSVKIPIFR